MSIVSAFMKFLWIKVFIIMLLYKKYIAITTEKYFYSERYFCSEIIA